MSNPVLDSLVNGIEERTGQVRKFMDPILDTVKTNFAHMSMAGMPSVMPKNIMIFGCGGTGGWLAPKLVKILNDACLKGMGDKYTLLFVDGDEIEEKNLIRQNFISQDVGKKKSAVMAERYGIHFCDKVEVGFIDNYLVDSTYHVPPEFAAKFGRLEDVQMLTANEDFLIVNLIDNGRTRKLIHRFASVQSIRAKKCYVMDVANNEYNGQLNLSAYGVTNPSAYLAQFYNQHPTHLGDDEDISVFSCADADADAVDQLFNANDMAAAVAGNFINAWVQDGKLKYGAVDFVTGASMSVTSHTPLIDLSLRDYGRGLGDVDQAKHVSLIRDAKSGMNLDEAMLFELGYNKCYEEAREKKPKNNLYFKDLDHACSSNNEVAE
jgi:hypothetical protein